MSYLDGDAIQPSPEQVGERHNELAAAYIPDNLKIEYNRNYFKTVRGIPAC